MIFDIGPFRFYRVEKNGTLDISLICMEDWACGWEYGWRDPLRGEDTPIIEFRIGKLMVAYLNMYNGGCEFWLLGFWAMPSWGKGDKKCKCIK
jgi:hypothetical protein